MTDSRKAQGRPARSGRNTVGHGLLRIRIVKEPMDMTFLILVLLLLTIGLVMLFSASYANAYYIMGNSFHYISSQVLYAAMGIVAMLFISYFDYHMFHQLARPMMILSLLLLVVVFGMPPLNNAHRWIFIGSSINFQPSEIAKFAVVILFAHWISIDPRGVTTITGLVPYGAVLLILAGLLIAEPHLSATILIVGIGAVMIVLGGANLRFLISAGGLGVAAMLFLVVALGKLDRAMGRIEHWLNPFLDPRGDGFQTIQSLYSIGSGGLMGAGIGGSRQKYLFLPEPQNDFIFSIVCEELGFIGATLIILLFAVLIWRGFVIGIRAKDRFGALIAIGLTSQIALQVLLNIAVATNTIPNTGIGLPFFSYGGTSMMMLLGQIGVILSISRQTKLEKE